ncbi:MAG: hypothetical protein CME62_11630 [Halobacteriovoraceae bacterium]|nr:hypothetical protein [Halobacteriovoraceae bacterium]|tara:strand:- start:3619 stop:4284 length:666 start_codon:yes stop_codon:yes gene_type:complete
MKKSYVFIGAHPDDIEIGCGGTVLKLLSEGHHCEFIVVTKGDQGSLTHSPTELTKIREKEARESAKLLGVENIHFMHLDDGLGGVQRKDKIALIKLIRTIRPYGAFIHSSTDHHPDHEIIHRLCLAAIGSSSGPWFPEGGDKPHSVSEIYGYEVWNTINRVQLTVDITPHLEKKLQALALHKSQIEDFPYMDAVKGLSTYRGAINGGGNAEVFEVISTQLK